MVYTGSNESFFSADGVDWRSSDEGGYKYTDEDKALLLEAFIDQLYDGLEEEDVEELQTAAVQTEYYTNLFAKSDIGIIMGNISLKAFSSEVGAPHFSHISGAVPMNEAVEISVSNGDKLSYIVDNGEVYTYTEPITIDKETPIRALNDTTGALASRDYYPAKAELFDLGYDTSPAFYSPVLKYAEKTSPDRWTIVVSSTADKIRFFPVSDCRIEQNGEILENYKVTPQYALTQGTNSFTFELTKENALPHTLTVDVIKDYVTFNLNDETIKINGSYEVYAPDGTRLITGSSVSDYAGEKLKVMDGGAEVYVDVPIRIDLTKIKCNVRSGRLILPEDAGYTWDMIEFAFGDTPSNGDFFSTDKDCNQFYISGWEKLTIRVKESANAFYTPPLVLEKDKLPECELGDANMNGIVDAVDATLILTHYARLSAGQDGVIDEDGLEFSDFNEDGTVDGRDATAVLSYYAQMSVEQ